MAIVEVKVPDIGDFKDVPVIDVLVKPGDAIKPEDPLVTLESDKATMDVPAPAAGTVKSIAVKVGDKVSQGALLLALESAAAKPAAGARAAPATSSTSAPHPSAASAAPSRPAAPASPAPPSGTGASSPNKANVPDERGDLECEMLVLGAGPGGYSAAFRAADLGMISCHRAGLRD